MNGNTLSHGSTRVLTAALLGVAITLAGTGAACASGFALLEQGVKQMGSGYAGTAATAEDPSVIAYNPAGIGFLEGTRFSGSLIGIQLHSDFDGQGYYGATGAPIAGGDGGNPGGVALVPSLFMSHRLDDKMAIGLGVYMPYGIKTDYDNDWTGRYQADRTKVFAVNINPVFAFKPTDHLSLGVGLVVQYFQAKLSNYIDAGTLAAGAAYQEQAQLHASGAPVPAPTQAQLAGALSDAQGQYDVHNDLRGHNIAYGLTAGILWEPLSGTRIGLNYHSATNVHINGKVDRSGFDQAGIAGALMPYFGPNLSLAVAQGMGAQLASTTAKTDVKLPNRVDLGIRQEITADLAVLAGVQWMEWSRFKQLRLQYADNSPTTIIPENYHDTYRFAGGAEYRINRAWTVRGGVAYDQSPVDSRNRTARVPDGDRLTLALGASYRPSTQLTLDIGYQHLFIHKGSLEEKAIGGSGNTLKGRFDSAANVLGVQANYMF